METETSKLVDVRYVRWPDGWRTPFRQAYYLASGAIGVFYMCWALMAYFWLVVYCYIRYGLVHVDLGNQARPRWPPSCVAYGCTGMRQWMLSVAMDRRGGIVWPVYFHLLQLSTFIEYVANVKDPGAYFNLLLKCTIKWQQQKNTKGPLTPSSRSPYFPVGDGLGISSHQLVLDAIHSTPASREGVPPIEKSETLAAWSVSSSITRFCSFIPIFKSSADPKKITDPAKPGDAELGRKIVFAWLHSFPHGFKNGELGREGELDRNGALRVWRIIPRVCDAKASDETIMMAVGELLFFLATGGELTKDERAAFLDTVKNPFIFFPDWFNFLVAGHYMERKSAASYDKLRHAFARYTDGPAFKAALNAAGSAKPPAEVLRLITIIYSVAGSVAPARLSVSILNKLWSDPDKYMPMFNKDKKRFVKECARLYVGIPIFVNVGANKKSVESAAQFGITIPEHTTLHCSMTQANKDPSVFKDAEEFNPDRADLEELIGWNGREKDIMQADFHKRPPRYCPGHDLSLDLLVFIAERFAPMTSEQAMVCTPTVTPSFVQPSAEWSTASSKMVPTSNKDKEDLFNSMTPIVPTSSEPAAPGGGKGKNKNKEGLRKRTPSVHIGDDDGDSKSLSLENDADKAEASGEEKGLGLAVNHHGLYQCSVGGLTNLQQEEQINATYNLSNTCEEAVIYNKYHHTLDYYTRLVILLMKVAVKEWNDKPPRGIDMLLPANNKVTTSCSARGTLTSAVSGAQAKGLEISRIDMAKFIAKWDEDEPAGSPLQRRLARWVLNLKIWEFVDYPAEFDSAEDAIAWRKFNFSNLPPPNVVFHRELDHSNDDQLMTQLAFTGIACHHTKVINWANHRSNPGLQDIAPLQSPSAIRQAQKKDCFNAHPAFIRQNSTGTGIPEQEQLRNQAVYVNDMTGLYQFQVRKPYERYGAAVYFDKNFAPIGIYWSHGQCLIKPSDSRWKWACYVWRSSMFAYVTIADHLITNHMIESNALSIASRSWLPAHHALRHFLKPFTYHNVSINYQAAQSLVNNRGLVHRIWAFEFDEFLKVCDYISMNYAFEILPDMIDDTMRDRDIGSNDFTDAHPGESWDKYFPLVKDADEYWDIVHTYVSKFFEVHYGSAGASTRRRDSNNHTPIVDKLPADNDLEMFIQELCKQLGIAGITSKSHLIDVISQLIVSGTALHEQVGQISEYVYDPTFIGCKLNQGKDMNSVQTLTQLLTLTVVTGLKMPGLLEDWSHLIPKGKTPGEYQMHTANYRCFIRDLEKLAKDIDERNKKRVYPYQAFNPRNLECSTSI